MEWAHKITPEITVAEVLAQCSLAHLPTLCEDVYTVDHIATDGSIAQITCVWGEFEIACRPIKNGVSYALISCPNAFQWSVTSRNGVTLVHGSINQMHPDPEFAESLIEFLQHFCVGLETQTGRLRA